MNYNLRSGITILLVLVSCKLNSQHKNGAYMNFAEFNKNKPCSEAVFVFEKIENKNIPELFRLLTHNKEVTPLMVQKIFWGVYTDSIFYLNAKKIGMTNGYICLGKLRPYMYFKGIPSSTPNQDAALLNSTAKLSAEQMLLTSAKIHKENKNKVHYVLNYKTGMVNYLTPDFMLRILCDEEDLLKNYTSEPEKESIHIMQTYLYLLNLRLIDKEA